MMDRVTRERISKSRTLPTVGLSVVPAIFVGVVLWGQKPYVWMWAVAAAIFVGCKWITFRAAIGNSFLSRAIGYWLAWPGLDANAFLAIGTKVERPDIREFAWAAIKTVVGVITFALALAYVSAAPFLTGWLAMLGLIAVLHFGSFHLLSCAWRTAGVDAKPLMRNPAASRAVAEFWGKRWNTAFRDITHRHLFRPLVKTLGPAWAILVGFIVSGVVHEVVITVPAGGGYGLPTAYFTLQGVAMLAERRISLKGIAGRVWTFVIVALPAPVLLFPPVFVRNVIVPMLTDISKGLGLP